MPTFDVPLIDPITNGLCYWPVVYTRPENLQRRIAEELPHIRRYQISARRYMAARRACGIINRLPPGIFKARQQARVFRNMNKLRALMAAAKRGAHEHD